MSKKYLSLFTISFLSLISPFLDANGTTTEKNSEISLTEKVAEGNDWVLKKGQKKGFLYPVTWVTSRTMGIALLPVCTALDISVLTTKQVKELPFLLNKNSPTYDSHLSQFQKNNHELKRRSLALVASPVSLLSPDIVTQHFVPDNTPADVIAPYGKLYSIHAFTVHPESIQDVQGIVQEANRQDKSISIMGSLMSQGKQAIANDDWNIVIDTSKLNQITIDPERKIAKVGAGATWADLQREAAKYGLAVRVMQASNVFSIGGSISVNCHGWDHHTGSLRNSVQDLTIVNAQGNIVKITPEDHLFDFVVGGYGGFGVIVEATLSLTENVTLVRKGVEIAPKDYLAYFNENIRNNPNVAMHLYRLSLKRNHFFETGISVNYEKTTDTPKVVQLYDEPPRGKTSDRIKVHTIRRIPLLRNFAWSVEKNDALSEEAMTRNEHMRPPINPVFNNSKLDTEWLQEYFVKGEDLNDFLVFLGNILNKNKVALFNASVRFVKHDPKTKLSYAPSEDHFAVVLFFNQKLNHKEIERTKKWVREIIDYLIAHEGTYYLPYQHFATKDQFNACYHQRKDVAKYKVLNDPQGIFKNGLYDDYITYDSNQDSQFRRVFMRVNGQREGISDFLNNIFMQLNDQQFFVLMDSILENSQLDDKKIYEKLFSKIDKAKPNVVSHLNRTLRSLKALKNELGDQTAELVGERTVNGYVEIGYPGRMIKPLKKRINIKGPLYAISEKEALSDYIEAGFPRPYDKFIPIGDYQPISEKEIPSQSVELVCMYIGLHHIPEDKIDEFILSIKRILKPGGMFILMDHDADSQELVDLVDVVHSIFNAGTGVIPEENNQEVRNFHSLQYWTERVESQGLFRSSHEPLVRAGDSTRNSLIRFDLPQNDGANLRHAIYEDNKRSQKQTYLTGPEWQNVRAAQRYADFVETDYAHNYPYFSEIGGFWKVYGESWNAARKENSLSDVAFSDYNIMNLFVGTAMTVEYGFKGLAAAPVSLVDKTFFNAKKKTDKSPSDQERMRSMRKYGQYIETTPFYQYPYFKDIGSYWKTYAQKKHTLGSRVKGLFVGTGMTLEYTIKGIVSAPMGLLYGSKALKEDETTHLLIHDQENRIAQIDPAIVIIEEYDDSSLKHVQIPRYMPFTQIIRKISQEPSISCINIAGNESIQLDVKIPSGVSSEFDEVYELYQIPNPTDKENRYVALEVNVNQLLPAIRMLENAGIEIQLIHDF